MSIPKSVNVKLDIKRAWKLENVKNVMFILENVFYSALHLP